MWIAEAPKLMPAAATTDAPMADVAAPDADYKTPAAKVALTTLLKRGVGLALAQTAQGGVFTPVAVTVNKKGKDHVVHVDVKPKKNAVGDVDLVAQKTALAKQVKKLKPTAAAVFVDGHVQDADSPNKTEAIVASFEHKDGTCLTVVVPYTRVGGVVKPLAPVSMPGECTPSML